MRPLACLASIVLGSIFCLTVSAAEVPSGPASQPATTKRVTSKARLELAGQVVDADTDQPLPGIRLQMNSYPRQGTTSAVAQAFSLIGGGVPNNATATTDAAGRFTFAVKPNCQVQMRVDQSGGDYLIDQNYQRPGYDGMFAFHSQDFSESKTDVKVKLKLRKLAPLSGKVVDSSGKPVATARVTIQGISPVTTDAEGNFSFKAAPTDRAGELTVLSADLGVIAPFAAGQKQISITAVPLVARELLFTTPEGTPADKLSFTMTLQSGPGAFRGQADNQKETDAEGKCHLDKLIVGGKYSAS